MYKYTTVRGNESQINIMRNDRIYQSILNHLSLVPIDYLQEVDIYLRNLIKILKRKEHNRKMILELAGSWNDMQEKDFNEFLFITKKIGNEMFNRDIEL
ncbi:MAG: hypothetical protein H7A23_19890 [Leptospiraceae bacterium]|nr:hypothetical protein [Leptospiraceae bacterium]